MEMAIIIQVNITTPATDGDAGIGREIGREIKIINIIRKGIMVMLMSVLDFLSDHRDIIIISHQGLLKYQSVHLSITVKMFRRCT